MTIVRLEIRYAGQSAGLTLDLDSVELPASVQVSGVEVTLSEGTDPGPRRPAQEPPGAEPGGSGLDRPRLTPEALRASRKVRGELDPEVHRVVRNVEYGRGVIAACGVVYPVECVVLDPVVSVTCARCQVAP